MIRSEILYAFSFREMIRNKMSHVLSFAKHAKFNEIKSFSHSLVISRNKIIGEKRNSNYLIITDKTYLLDVGKTWDILFKYIYLGLPSLAGPFWPSGCPIKADISQLTHPAGSVQEVRSRQYCYGCPVFSHPILAVMLGSSSPAQLSYPFYHVLNVLSYLWLCPVLAVTCPGSPKLSWRRCFCRSSLKTSDD